ncbi:MAG: MBL fold metallo-hydrolase [Deltaproteobacteria bacterium RBG_13_52_11]|nr:MAG: MBL fold metallo-hydrolase [Deltaproteobacteria bacterium RBG_13_52_11]
MKVELKKGIYWVGAIDWNIRDFHGYSTHKGSSYNAYLVVGEKTALVDTVKAPFFEEMMGRIREVLPPEKIDYVIVNHVEMDHSGSLPLFKEALPKVEVMCSPRAEEELKLHYGGKIPLKVVKTGDILELGEKTLTFVEIPMVHWPDSMVTYVKEAKVLLPNDAFGQHIASTERFDDELGWDAIRPEATKYYANIVMPYGPQVLKALEALQGIEIEVIGPSHGIIWRKHIPEIVASYERWAKGETEKKALIVYDTMWGSTERMAKAICRGLVEEGVPTKVYRLGVSDTSDIVKEVLEARSMLLGSPTLNNGVFPSVAEFSCYIKGLRPKGRITAVFGSYGWGKGATAKALAADLQAAGMEVMEELQVQFVPDGDALNQCEELGRRVAQKIKKS